MSFFHELPPLDSDIPPPLDDKLKDNDFDLDDEEIIIEDEELPELPTDFNVFSSAATDDNHSYSHPPPEFQNFAVHSSPPPDIPLTVDNKSVENESPESSDVAKEKESFKIDDVVPQHRIDRFAGNDIEVNDITGTTLDKETINEHVKIQTANNIVDDEKSFNSAAALDELNIGIPLKLNEPFDDNLHSNKVDNEVLENVEQHVNDKKLELDEDDDFADFVEATPTESESREESFNAFKTEDILGKSEEFGMFTGLETNIDDIPEPIPELKLDDDGDDGFNDFETAIPFNRHVDQVKSCAINEKNFEEPQEITFEADFSSFNAFSEPSEENKYDELKDVKTSELNHESKLSSLQVEDDDDDFGDFEDFTQAPTSVTLQPAQTETIAINFVKPKNVNGVIDMMFPFTSSLVHEKPEKLDSENAREQQVIKSDNFVNKFNDFDSTVALGYLYNNSKASQSLVVALGIDTRNILLGPLWTSSSSSAQSNMPRFAANLSFNPIEPMKPTSSQSLTVKSSEETKPPILQPTKAPTETVPEAEFDWNSSGLVNPLDGPQPKPQQSHDVEPITLKQPAAPPAHFFENESSLYVVDQKVAQVLEAETKANASHKPELSEPSVYQWSNEISSQHHTLGHFSNSAASSNILVRERTIKLPETHIFTPVKGTSPVAREVISRDVSPAPDDTYFPKGPITVKEYHDVEYSLEPKKRIDSDADFDDFQSAQPTVVNSDPPLVPLNLLEPQKVDKPSTEIKWPEPGNITQSVSSDLDFLEAPALAPLATSTVTAPKLNFIRPLAPSSSTVSNKKKEAVFSKPVIGTSPTEHNGSTEDDDFNDFQAAPPQNQQTKKLQPNDPITLSPARLQASVSNQSNQKSSWISSMDNDEISRIEAAFPKCKTDKKVSNEDEDDWSDFVGAVQPTSLPYSSSQLPPSTISSNSIGSSSKVSNGDTDDWSDFVSVPPPISRMPSVKSSSAISSQYQSKPNFSSWHQPVGKPYVNHTTSFLTNDAGNMNQQFTSSNYPFVTDKVPRHSMTITNNFNYNFNATSASTHHQQPKPNGISTILPELDFAMPKNLINLPRGGPIDPGKK